MTRRWSDIAKVTVIPLNAVIMGPVWLAYAKWMLVLGMLASGYLYTAAVWRLAKASNE